MAESRDPSLDSETSTDATAEARVRQLFVEGSLTDDVVATALDGRENEFVMAALALRAGYPVETIRRMVCVQSARTIVALSWKAGILARFAMDLQRQLAGILPTKTVNARDGVYHAHSTSEIQKLLSLFDKNRDPLHRDRPCMVPPLPLKSS